ncbi:hypothetical protein C2845_PM01G47980 [Panicum miliaceum]|uniref:Uncharacterized protein n=1 Tax=Panicum miliaceum TaxID=4540 RepID=A0A3L6TSW8_PANMI|nr:hypothetical protein C2845_PM01G47980 [Panicum miliaceum]
MDKMKTTSVKSRRKVMAGSNRMPVRWECERLEGVMALGGDRARVNIGVAWEPSGGWTVWVVWASKPLCKQVSRFGPKNRRCVRCACMAVMEGLWRHPEAYVEVKQSCEGGVLPML